MVCACYVRACVWVYGWVVDVGVTTYELLQRRIWGCLSACLPVCLPDSVCLPVSLSCACMCVCVYVPMSVTLSGRLDAWLSALLVCLVKLVCVCVCVCVCRRCGCVRGSGWGGGLGHKQTHTHTHTHTHWTRNMSCCASPIDRPYATPGGRKATKSRQEWHGRAVFVGRGRKKGLKTT